MIGSTEREDGVLGHVALALDEDPPRVVASGELDLSAVPAVSAALDQLRATGATRAVVDLTGVTFVDLAGLRAFAAAATDGLDLEVRGANRMARRLLELTAFDRVLRCDT